MVGSHSLVAPFHPPGTPALDTKAIPLQFFEGMSREREKDMWKNGARGERNGVGWVAVGAASIVAMRKQSNTKSSHSRGTAGAHREGCLGGL